MTESDVQRLSSTHLEDMAFIILSARANGDSFELYPDLGDETRTRLRSRIKQLSRYDWPSSLREDPAFRRGYTLRQCCRLVIVLLLLDAHLPPSLAVALAQNNEIGFLRAIADRLADPSRQEASPGDIVAIVIPGEIQDALYFTGRENFQGERVHFFERGDRARMWSAALPEAGARLVIDIPTAAAALWRWIGGRRLMDDSARQMLLADIGKSRLEPEFVRTAERRLRR